MCTEQLEWLHLIKMLASIKKLDINFMTVQIYGFYIKWIFSDVKC